MEEPRRSSGSAIGGGVEHAEVHRHLARVAEDDRRAPDDGLLENAHPFVHLHLARVQRHGAVLQAAAPHAHVLHRARARRPDRHLVLRLLPDDVPRLPHRERYVGLAAGGSLGVTCIYVQ